MNDEKQLNSFKMAARLAPPLPNVCLGEDVPTVVDAKIAWYDGDDMKRVSSISDGHCLPHALLRATSKPYRDLKTVQERSRYAAAFRKELITGLSAKEYESVERKYALSKCGWPKRNLLKLLMGNLALGAEVMGLMCELTGVTIHLVQLFTTGEYVPVESVEGVRDRHVVILNVANHFELIVRKNGRGTYEVNFHLEDPFIQSLIRKRYERRDRTKPEGKRQSVRL